MPSGLSQRIENFRGRVQRRNKAKQADQRAEAREERIELREQAEEERARQQRIEANTPEGVREEAQASIRQTRLLASELGIDTASAREVADEASQVLESAREQGQEAVSQLDTDGDGDTDILQIFESESNEQDAFDVESVVTGGQGGQQTGEPVDPGTMSFSPVDPVEPSGGQSDNGGIDPTSGGFERELLDL